MLALLFLFGLSGAVRDASTGETLARARVTLACGDERVEAQTGADGRFSFARDAAGCLVHVSLVGYRPLRVEAGPATELELALTSDTLRRRDSVDVSAGPFEAAAESSASERRLSGAEVKNLAAVLIDDPLRAAQALPGVASSNDYVAQFTVRGAPFRQVGIYLDGVLLHSPFHTVQSQEETGSLSMIGADVIEELTVHTGAMPAQYQDRTSGALDLRMREGNYDAPAIRLNFGVASSGVVAEGPLGRARKGSYLAAVRKSYLQYLLRKSSAADTLAFGFLDAQARLAYRLTERQQATLSYFDGASNLDRTHVRDTLGINAIMNGETRVTMANAAWRYAPRGSVLVTQRLAYQRERSRLENNRDLELGGAGYTEWAWTGTLGWNWRANAPLQVGGSLRRIHDDGFSARYNFNPLAVRRWDNWRGQARRAGAYIEQAVGAGPLRVTLGGRVDRDDATSTTAVSPHASAALRLSATTRLQAAFSQAVQFPALMPLRIENMGNAGLAAERANHAVAAIEQRLGERTRIRVESFYRVDRDGIAQPLLEPRRLASGAYFTPPASPRYENSVRGTSRGYEVFVERRTANRLAGWLSYAWTKTALRDSVTGARYRSDSEQRHTANAYASYRVTASLNLSARFSYGSNYPIPGFLELRDGLYYLSGTRNALTLPSYTRADFRLNKSFHHQTARGWTWRGTLYAEVMNLTNHANRTYDSFGGFNARTGQAYPSFLKLFPLVPAAGLMVEWDRGVGRR